VGGTLIGTVTLTQGGTGNCTGFSSTSVCVDVEMTSGSVRVGGPVIGFSGNVNEGGPSIVSDVGGGLALALGACGGITMETICLDANGSATTSSLLCPQQCRDFKREKRWQYPRRWRILR
jgi:hypothetical protein